MHLKLLLSLGFSILLSSCASSTSNYYPQTIASWKGGDVHSLTKRWGTPDIRSISPKGETILVYRTQNYKTYSTTISHPAVGVVNFDRSGRPVIVNVPDTNASLGQNNVSCSALFVVNHQGVITDTQVKGVGCYGSDHFAATKGNPAQ